MNKVKLSEVCTVIVPMRDKPKEFVSKNKGIPWCRIEDIEGKFLNGSKSHKYVSTECITKMNLRIFPKGTVLCAVTGASIGTYAITTNELITNQTFAGLVCGEELYNEYLYYYIKLHTNVFINNSVGCAQAYITRETLESLMIPLIPYEEQVRLVSILKFIDDKIYNNDKINIELENAKKAIYDYWFLQFDFPNQDGKPYKSSGGKMVWNDEVKREVPESWQVESLRKYVDVIRGVSYDKKDISMEHRQGYVPLLKANNIQDGVISYDNLVYVKKEKISNEQMLTKNSILITMSSGSKEHMGKTAVIYETIPYTCGAFCAKIKCLPEYRGFLALYFRHSLFKNNIAQMSIGTNINNINNEHIYEMKIPVPPKMILKQYEDIVGIVLDKQGQISKENQELIQLRDFLLPLLMNGQVGFKEDK